MRYGYENIKNIKCGKLSLAEKNKTVNGIYLDITDKFENIANFTFTTNEAEQLANELLQAVFDATEKQILKNKKDITQEEWKVIDEKNWAKTKSKILNSIDYSDYHLFIKSLKIVDYHDGNILSLVSSVYVFVQKEYLEEVCRVILDVEGGRASHIIIYFDNTRQDEYECGL
ncbi:hypothetical protein [Chromatium okenii]|jgi:hypothetical protein|uniref:hypothetical protein n=1 Tax=Chromatium okenii TaxID=61644 RepID=UPI0026EFA9F9|nr:hypothetical protein [Chromatium okenii]MBV5309288.1 hypothetical protein [Chromatium okenii]